MMTDFSAPPNQPNSKLESVVTSICLVIVRDCSPVFKTFRTHQLHPIVLWDVSGRAFSRSVPNWRCTKCSPCSPGSSYGVPNWIQTESKRCLSVRILICRFYHLLSDVRERQMDKAAFEFFYEFFELDALGSEELLIFVLNCLRCPQRRVYHHCASSRESFLSHLVCA